MHLTYDGINSALQDLCRRIVDGRDIVKRETRGQICYEFNEPMLIEITDPTSRLCTVPERKWVLTLPYAESLWLASGRNDMNLIGHYVKNMYNFSDDGKYMRAGYGPRLRKYNGSKNDYKESDFSDGDSGQIDQFKFIVESFKRDENTRQAVISIHDPMKDDFNLDGTLKVTKDQPCSRNLQLQRSVEGKLNMTLYIRSNDVLWGFSAVNVFNFTFMQEYFSSILNMPMGSYYHFANNLHVYDYSMEQVRAIAESKDEPDYSFTYKKKFNFEDFNNYIRVLEIEEEKFRKGNGSIRKPLKLEEQFFSDWLNVFIWRNVKVDSKAKFENPILQEIIERKMK